MRSFDELLTQTALVKVRSKAYDAQGRESIAAATDLYTAEPCRVLPVSTSKANAIGLDLDKENFLLMFSGSVSLTRDVATGKDYQDVDILVDSVHYCPSSPQSLVGLTEVRNGVVPHVEVYCVRRS